MQKQGTRNIIGIIIRITLALFALGFIFFLSYKIKFAFSGNKKALTEHLPSEYSLKKEDSNLISEKYRSSLKVNEVYRSKVRNPISLVYFGQEYNLIIYKIDLIKDISLKFIFNTEIKSVDQSTGYTYSIIGQNIYFNFKYKAGLIQPVSKIFLTLSGDSLQTVCENDSILSYHLLCNNFSIRYAEKGPIDIFVGGKDRSLWTTTLIPMDLLLLKRNSAIYLLVMTPNNPKSNISHDLLYDVIMGI